ncbi:MAG: sigma-70 family RNA polymerase sigma factor [Candidatus Sericytochromatia bacterium]|nr:sigma-70 family RNA polymerase sigma factor [Candidatus Tanganyikabacteria bacterium]
MDSLLQEYRSTPSPRARDALVRRHLKLVKQIAAAHASRTERNVDDLVQVGSIGLLNAIERFDTEQGASFEAYAGACIAGEIRHYLRDLGHLVKPPRELQELRPQVLRAISRLAQRSYRSPTPDEIAAETGLPPGKIEEVLALEERGVPLSLDAETNEDGDKAAWKYQLIDNRYRSFQLAAEDRIMLGQAMGHMRDVSREVIEFAFFQDLTQTEIAKKLGISQMQVSRRLRTAMGELWKSLNSRLWD